MKKTIQRMNINRLFCRKLTKTDRPSVQQSKERDEPSKRQGEQATHSTTDTKGIHRTIREYFKYNNKSIAIN